MKELNLQFDCQSLEVEARVHLVGHLALGDQVEYMRMLFFECQSSDTCPIHQVHGVAVPHLQVCPLSQ